MASNNVLVNNLCAWPLYFKRVTGQGDIEIPANAKRFPLISFEEAQAQIQLGNRLFVGTDGVGGHARIEFVDEQQRKLAFGLDGVEMDDPIVLNEEVVHELLAIKGKEKFNKRLNDLVKTDAEKRMLVDIAFRVGAENAETWKVDALRALADTATI